jgi:hypothetical protein
MDDYERMAKELVDRAAEGCCQNGQWRGRLCSYHEGYRDGVWAAEAALIDAAQRDGSSDA